MPCVLYVLATAAGLLSASRWQGTPEQLWQGAAGTVPSLTDACMVTVVPLLLAVWAVLTFRRTGICAAAMLRGSSLGLALGTAVGCMGIGIGTMLLFGAILSGGVMLWFLLGRMRLGREHLWQDALLCLGLDLAIALADTLWVAPWLRRMITF